MAREIYRGNLVSFVPAPGVPVPTPLGAINQVLTQYTAEQLADYADRLWEQPRVPGRDLVQGAGANNLQHQGWSLNLRGPARAAPVPPPAAYWYHLIYAYLLECTNLRRVFDRVVAEWTHGERLPFASQASQMWLRTTEQLFFTHPLPPSIRSLSSDVRPDPEAILRNACYRMFGLDLPHGTKDGRAYPYVKADVANREFVRAWEELLKYVWAAYTNRRNLVGTDTTDESGMQELVRELQQMLTARRNGGAISREEFDAVMWFSWFHLAILADSQIVVDLTAQSTSAAMRLKKIADRVGVPIHAKADSFIQMAIPMALVLEAIESGVVGPANVDRLYLGTGVLAQSMRLITTHWSLTTGRAMKGVDVSGLPPQRSIPLAAGAGAAAAAAGGIPASRIEFAMR
jgi:hypothetical protein